MAADDADLEIGLSWDKTEQRLSARTYASTGRAAARTNGSSPAIRST